VDVIVDPSRFLLELPADVTKKITVAEQRETDGFDALPEPRYQLPAFLEEPTDDDEGGVN